MKMACGCCTIVQCGPKEFTIECIPAHSILPEPVHSAWKDYPCPKTHCVTYIPAHYPLVSKEGIPIWPVCVCGEIAQEHV